MKKVVLITGGSSGIGKSVGEYLMEKGFTVYGTSRMPANYKNSKFQLLELDTTKKESILNTIQKIILMEGYIDILINNAGIGITGSIEETPIDEIRNVFETNLFGAIEVMKAVLPIMRKQQSGKIINVTSIAGYMGLPFRGIYSATKGAFELVSESIRMEVKEFGIDVVSVAPGDFATDIASRRFHTPVFENSPYKKKYQTNLDLINEHVNGGSNPLEIAEVIYEIIQLKKTKVHYKVGSFMQKFSIFLKRILPDTIYEKLLLNHYKL